MASTQATTSDDGTTTTSLADALKTDEPQDRRACRHEHCHGKLVVTNDDRVVCNSCRCTPSGIFVPPDSRSGSSGRDPWGSRVEITDRETWDHDEYDDTDTIRLAGGYEPVYDEDDDNRPVGVGSEYTFDLSTL